MLRILLSLLQTLPVRVRAQQENATELAKRLAAHPAVRSVHFPRLEGEEGEGEGGGSGSGSGAMARQQMRGPGSVLSFCVTGGAAAAAAVVEQLHLITPAVSLGSVDTLIQAPATLTHRVVAPEEREGSGVSDDLLRLSVGLENVDDLWADLDQALNHVFG